MRFPVIQLRNEGIRAVTEHLLLTFVRFFSLIPCTCSAFCNLEYGLCALCPCFSNLSYQFWFPKNHVAVSLSWVGSQYLNFFHNSLEVSVLLWAFLNSRLSFFFLPELIVLSETVESCKAYMWFFGCIISEFNVQIRK